MDQIEIRPPKTEAEWKKYDDFRWEILRKPLKTPNVPLKDNLEDVSFHFIAINSDNIIKACGRVHLNSSDEAQIRYMAVDKDHRRMGLGSAIVKKLEAEAKLLGATYVMLNARENAINFYKSHGYDEIAPYNSNIDVPHTRMEKRLI
ncbi:MAG: GNAT family N-acetyltransferase [Gammaproteobacteria bacterium]|jgi:predicted GNAT family N-acyltransferase